MFHIAAAPALLRAAARKTEVAIRGNQFFINGQPTYKGRSYKGHQIEGLLMNSRMVQGIFDDKNPETASRWAYPDTKKWDPKRIAEMVRQTRSVESYRPMPILFNEDDHFDFDKPENNMMAAISEYASWGYLELGSSNYADGFQCPPVDWGINSELKKSFFSLLREVTGS